MQLGGRVAHTIMRDLYHRYSSIRTLEPWARPFVREGRDTDSGKKEPMSGGDLTRRA